MHVPIAGSQKQSISKEEENKSKFAQNDILIIFTIQQKDSVS